MKTDPVVTEDQISSFQRDGAVVLRSVLSATEVASLTRGVDTNLAAPGPMALVASKPDDPGYFIEDFCNWSTNHDYRDVVFNSRLPEAAALLTGSRETRMYHDHMLTKEPGTHQRTPWHQDQPYYNVSGQQNVSFWIPVDPVRRSSTLEFIAGSHLGPWLMPRTFMDKQAKWFPEGTLADLPDIDANRESYNIIGWELEPGDAVAFHMLTLHAAAGVDPDRRRRVFSVRYLGDDMRHAPRPWKTSPDFPGLTDTPRRWGTPGRPALPRRLAEVVSSADAGARTDSVTVSTGATMFWRELGNPDGVPMLWIHGGSVEDSSMMVNDLAPFFDRLRVICPDVRGHGRSSRYELVDEYRWAKKSADIVALLDHLGLERPIWGGNSMGAALSLWTGVHEPDRVAAIVDISGPPAATDEREAEWWQEHRPLVEDGRFAEYYEANVFRRSGPVALAKLKAKPQRHREIVELLHRHSVASFLALLDETFDRPDWVDQCARIPVPTLVIGGTEDTFPDEHQTRRVAEQIPDSVLHMVQGGPHFPNRTHRSEVQQVIASFLGSRLGL